MRTPRDIYALPVESVDCEKDSLVGYYYDHVPEVAHDGWQYMAVDLSKTGIEVRVHCHSNYDSRRFWRLASVWLDGNPVMVIQNAGREGDDHHKRFVTDKDLLFALAARIRMAIAAVPMKYEVDEMVGLNDWITGLDSFYAHSYDSVKAIGLSL